MACIDKNLDNMVSVYLVGMVNVYLEARVEDKSHSWCSFEQLFHFKCSYSI